MPTSPADDTIRAMRICREVAGDIARVGGGERYPSFLFPRFFHRLPHILQSYDLHHILYIT
jgi:hypothetical protein